MINDILFKIKNFDDLFDDLQNSRIEIDNLNVYIQQMEVNLGEVKSELDEEKEKNDILRGKLNYLELPKNSLKELEKRLLLADYYTLQIIVDYLVLDSYELVKNIASKANSENIDNYIAYRDGALGRNEELKALLQRHISKKDNFIDRISGEEKVKRGK